MTKGAGMFFPRWWTDWQNFRTNENFSILDVVNSGTVDIKLASLLWLLMEHRASVMVAAGPSFAGKTTLLHALLDFLRPEIHKVSLLGYDENFKILDRSKPDKTYLVAEEISNHSYEYLWGYQVNKAFELLPRGYALGGTIHARSAKEAVYVLYRALGVPLSLIAQLGVVITLQVTLGRSYDDEPIRYVDTVSILSPAKEGLTIQVLSVRQSPDGKFIYPSDQALQNALFSKFAIKYAPSEIGAREKYLSEIRDKGVFSREEVRKAILEYYQS
jgi:energy-coupling factor transporter ATP-binding protein EcfA2